MRSSTSTRWPNWQLLLTAGLTRRRQSRREVANTIANFVEREKSLRINPARRATCYDPISTIRLSVDDLTDVYSRLMSATA
jgi:ubiquinone biosynthesis protein UbiJ